MAPLPFISGLYHGTTEKALDMTFEPYPVKENGLWFSACVEAINSLAAIKKVVYDEKRYTLDEIYRACESDFKCENGEIIRAELWNCPKWGNDDDYIDSIAKDLLEFCLTECHKHRNLYGRRFLAGLHQPHPVTSGRNLPATPEGRSAYSPLAVSMTPESGTVKKGATAVLRSAAKLDPSLIHWTHCIMVNYYSSIFDGENGKENFKAMLKSYFDMGGLQHQPNITNVEDLKKARNEPEKYRDLIVRLWGVSAYFVDLPRELQDEMIARFQ